jgi:Fe-S cluster biogenesis protein NfuA/nitrite reductase/ring-hydroxylating ferredoxin subunit
LDDAAARDLVARVETLLGDMASLPDPGTREKATAVVQALLDLYGEGLERIVERVAERDDGALAEALAGDELVSHLLILHGLHPVPLEARVRAALDEVRPYLESHGGNVDLVGLDGGIARLRLEGSCSGCPSSTMTLKLAIEDAINKAAPDVEGIEAEGAASSEPGPALLQLEVSEALARPPEPTGGAEGTWGMAGAMAELANGGPLLKEVSGERVLFMKLDSTYYAYRPECPACGESLAGAEVRGVELECPSCGNHYDVLRAGRCLDAPELHLEPVPLLVGDDGLVRVALGSVA